MSKGTEFIEAGLEVDNFNEQMYLYLDEDFESFIEGLIEAGEFDAEKALTTKDRKSLNASTFCGPNRTWPVPDCTRVSAARAYLARGFPKGASADIKARIRACVERKAKSLGCDSKKKKESDELSDLIEYHSLIHKWWTMPDGESIFDREALISAHSRIVTHLMKYEFPSMHKVVDKLDETLHWRFQSKED